MLPTTIIRHNLRRFFLCLLPLTCATTFAYGAAPIYEKPLTIDISEIYGTQSLVTPHYQIEPMVVNDGRMNDYRITSNIQNIEAYGDQMLVERLHEIETIIALREIKDSEAYSKGLENAANVPLALARNTIEDPVGTLEAIPGGVSNLLDDLGAALGSMGKDEKSDSSAMLKDLVGFNTVKRRLASELGVDPYSSNKLLQTELDDVAWSMFAGGATIDAMMAAAPMAASVGLRISDNSNKAQTDWKIPPATVLQAASKKVIEIGLNQAEATQLLYHPICSFNHLTIMVAALAEIQNVDGRSAFLHAATNASNENECRNYQEVAMLLHYYHANEKALQQLRIDGNSISAVDINGNRILPVNADYFLWTEINSQLVMLPVAGGKRNLMLSGRASSMTRDRAVKLNFTIRENTLNTADAPINIIKVLLPERVQDQTASQENKTGKMVDGVASGIGGTLNGLLNALNAPQSDPAEKDQSQTEVTGNEL